MACNGAGFVGRRREKDLMKNINTNQLPALGKVTKGGKTPDPVQHPQNNKPKLNSKDLGTLRQLPGTNK
jgi:hypothetical protein